jgi:hypothetical protein
MLLSVAPTAGPRSYPLTTAKVAPTNTEKLYTDGGYSFLQVVSIKKRL